MNPGAENGGSWALWYRQAAAIFSLELFRRFIGLRALGLYTLALLPILLMLIRLVVPMNPEEVGDMAGESVIFAGTYRGLMLQGVIFFGCALIFVNLFRGEISDQSLHYYFMTPVRREVLAAGKYVSGLFGTVVVFCLMTALSYILFFLRHGMDHFSNFFFDGPGLSHLLAYVVATILGSIGYGAMFITLGLVLRNPILPLALYFLLHWFYPWMPTIIKALTVVHYLNPILPVEVDAGPFSIIAEPPPVWVAIPGFLVFSVVVLFLCGFLIRRKEIRYESD